MRHKNECGAVTLEACISVLSFLILMLLLSSLFVMFMAQNVTAHTVLQTSQSLSLENYTIEKMVLSDGKVGSVSDYLADFVKHLFGSSEKNPNFVTEAHWTSLDSTAIGEIAKTRFVGYLSGGDKEKADEYLEMLNVVDGLDGLDFSKSYVSDDTLYIVLNYQLEYDFNIWNLGIVDVEQNTCSKLWK